MLGTRKISIISHNPNRPKKKYPMKIATVAQPIIARMSWKIPEAVLPQ